LGPGAIDRFEGKEVEEVEEVEDRVVMILTSYRDQIKSN
jgi:hypothetical protein